jgi:hypothetical protein
VAGDTKSKSSSLGGRNRFNLPPFYLDAGHRMVFTRSHLARSMAFVLGIVFSTALNIGSLVLFLMRLVGVK